MERLKSPLPPQILRGNAVEECVCRVLRESPVLISIDSRESMKSPLAEDGSPNLDDNESWISPTLEPLPESEWPDDRDTLREWALARVDAHFESCWESAIIDWESQPNRVGDSGDIDFHEGLEMARSAIDLHLDQVEKCLDSGGGPGFEDWRSGNRDFWPSPDGFPRKWQAIHPAAGKGAITWVEAWEVARPWFVDPDAMRFTQTSSHPGEWFQGEYDLVYRWTGSPRIVDLKASIGKGDRSGGYIQQLRMYCWLWWETHERKEVPESLEIWYLGTGTAKDVPIPEEKELLEMSTDLEELYSTVHAKDPSPNDCPAEPSPLRFFEKGGIPSGTPVHPEPRARCINCDYRGVCEGSEYEPELPLESKVERFGHSWPITPIEQIATRADATGEVVSLKGPTLNDDGTIDLEFTLRDGYDRATVRPSRQGSTKSVTRYISEGSKVKVRGAVPSVWRGQLQLDLDPKSSISLAKEGDEAQIVEIETRVSVVGRVWSIDAYPNGVDVHRWSITLMDKTGSAASVAFKQFIPISAAAITRGDDVAILNGEVGEWAGRPQVRIGPGARVVILRHSEDTPDF